MYNSACKKSLHLLLSPLNTQKTKLWIVHLSHDEEEMDIVQCGWTDYRMSEKKLIELMEKRIKGEKIELPEGY